jgi:Zn ribbon nucleic-acid-binding protein
MPGPLHLQHPPCPKCGSMQTISTARTDTEETLYCPDCGHTWKGAIKPVMERVNPKNAGR